MELSATNIELQKKLAEKPVGMPGTQGTDGVNNLDYPQGIYDRSKIVDALLAGAGKFVTHDSGQRQEFPSGMRRDVQEEKILWHLVNSGPMLERWAELLTRGAKKYGPDNWLLASGEEELQRFRASAFRHFMQWYRGVLDGEDHAAAVIFNINGAEYTKEKI